MPKCGNLKRREFFCDRESLETSTLPIVDS